LTIDLMEESGATLNIEEEKTTIAPWTPNPPTEWIVPSDGSMMAFPILACVLKKQSVYIENPVEEKDALGHEIILDFLSHFGVEMNDQTLNYAGKGTFVEINLRDANDLLPPLAAILALSGGGRLVGASHAKHKESNRIESAASLLRSFGLQCKIEDYGLSIDGGQTIIRPTTIVDTYGDHRIQMTALLLASESGGTVEGPRLHQIADPGFLQRFSSVPTEVLVKGIQR
jgi:3-phosphoshikimate 1-carboxyvinyltransferase